MSSATLSPKRISQARLRAGLSQGDVAFALRKHGHKTDGMTISRWERGQNAPRANVISDLAIVLGVDIEQLYERSESGDDDDEEDDALRRLRAVAADLAQRDLDDLASELLGIAALVARTHNQEVQQ